MTCIPPKWRGMAMIALAVPLIFGCRTTQPASPRLLIVNYNIAIVPSSQAAGLVADVTSAQTTIAALMVTSPTNNFWTRCNFTANFARNPPRLEVSRANPGSFGFVVRITAASPINITTTNIPRCGEVGQLDYDIGRRNDTPALNVGETTRSVEGGILLTDGRDFRTPPFATGRINRFDEATRRTAGQFSLIDSVPLADGNVAVLIAEGQFDMTP